MFGDLLSRHWFQVGLVSLVLLLVGSLLYSQHVQRTTEKAMEQHNRSLQEHAEQNETRPTAVAASPYGFGAYPELPEGWPADKIWPAISADHELMDRVMVELAHQGIITWGATMENGLVYPTYPGAVYIKWGYKQKNGSLYIADVLGDGSAIDRISAIEEARGDAFKKADIPPDITVLSYEEDGIDPYTFLNLH